MNNKNNSVSYTYKKNKKKQAVKKDFQSIVIITIISLLVIISLIMGLIFWGVAKKSKTSIYPTSPLLEESSSRYQYLESADLPYQVTFPTVPVMLSMGGSNRYNPNNGFVYLYSSNLYLSAYELYGTTYDLYSSQFVYDLYAGEVDASVVYDSDKSYKGYYNGYPTRYECGRCELLGASGRVEKTIYLVSLTMDLGLSYPINITVSTPSENQLYNAGKLLQKVGNTIIDISNTSYVNENGNIEGEAVIGIPVVD